MLISDFLSMEKRKEEERIYSDLKRKGAEFYNKYKYRKNLLEKK